MPSNTDVMIKVEANVGQLLKDLENVERALKQTQTTINNQLNPSTQTFSNRVVSAGSKVKALGTTIKQKIGTEGALAFAAVGTAAMSFTKQCIESAISAESAWTQMNALLQDKSSGTGMSLDEAKGKIRNYANEWGYMVGDVRAAGNALLLTGLDNNKLELGLKATAGVAARTGRTMEQASTLVSRALAGNGRDFERLTGLRLKDYKAANGQIDQERLLNDLYNQNSGAISKHADTTEAAVARMNTAWARIKTEVGEALLPVVKIVGDVVEKIADWFTNLPEPAKQVIAALLLITGAVATVIGVLGFLAPILIAAGDAIMFIGTVLAPVISVISLFWRVLSGAGVMAALSLLFDVLAGAALLLLDAIAPLILPILAVAAAFAVLYLFGQRMGWWNDLSGMIQKFGEVIMWVGGLIGQFLGWLYTLFTDFPTAMSQAGEVLGNFKGIILNALSGLWDLGVNAARELWDGFMGRLGEMGGAISETVSKIPDIIREKLSSLGDTIVPGGGLTAGILAIFLPIPTLIWGIIARIGPIIMQGLMNAATSARLGAQRVVQNIRNRFNLAVAQTRQVFTNIVNAIRSRLNNARTVAGNLVNRIRQVLVTRFNQAVARVRQTIGRIPTTIRDKLVDAVNKAKAKAKEIYDGIVNKIKEIPDKVAEEFGRIPGIVADKLKQAAANALTGAISIVSSIFSGLKTNSPGIIQRTVKWEFESLAPIIKNAGEKASHTAGNMAKQIVNTWFGLFGNGLNVPVIGSEEETLRIDNKALQKIPTIPIGTGQVSLDDLNMPTSGQTTNTTNTTRNTSIHNDTKEIHNHYDNVNINLNELPTNERERFYNLLCDLVPGGV